jgi:hypothetical protein
MPYTNVWSLSLPDGDEPAPTIDDIIRQLKLDLEERINTILGFPQDQAFADPLIAYFDAGNSGTAKEIDWANGPIQYVTMTGNCVFTFANAVSGRPYVLVMIQGSGGHTASLTGFNFGDGAFTPNTGAGLKNAVTGLWDGTEYIAGSFATGV